MTDTPTLQARIRAWLARQREHAADCAVAALLRKGE